MAYIKNPVQAVSYCKFRPSPPTELIEEIVAFLKQGIQTPLGCALDVGCGSGQSTEILAPYFQQVIGVDSSKEQLHHAKTNCRHQNVSYRLGSAEHLLEPDGSVHLVTAGMAVHWFNLQQFITEVGRVMQPQGVLAVYGYNLPQPVVNNVSLGDTVQKMIGNMFGQYIPNESKLAYFDGYKGDQFSTFPFSNKPTKRYEFLSTMKNAHISDLVGYISTMSGFQNFMTKHGETEASGLLSAFKNQVAEELGETKNIEEVTFDITFPYFLLLSKKDI